MSSLYDKSINNLKTLQSIQKDEILISSPSRELSIQGEYVQIDNRTELESAIFFTFHQILSLLNTFDIVKYCSLIETIDQTIDNIFENNQLNALLENEESELREIIDGIDTLLQYYKDYIFYDSQLFKPYYNLLRLWEYTIKNKNYIQLIDSSGKFYIQKDISEEYDLDNETEESGEDCENDETKDNNYQGDEVKDE